MTDAVTSPCIKVCTLDTETGWCYGCGRSGQEIASWLKATDAERMAILAALPGRMRQLDAGFAAVKKD